MSGKGVAPRFSEGRLIAFHRNGVPRVFLRFERKGFVLLRERFLFHQFLHFRKEVKGILCELFRSLPHSGADPKHEHLPKSAEGEVVGVLREFRDLFQSIRQVVLNG